MDLNYDVEAWMPSLRTMAMVNSINSIMKSVGIVPGSRMLPETVTPEIYKRIGSLQMPVMLIDAMKTMAHPIMLEMLRWYKQNTGAHGVSLVLTPWGTVDSVKSAKALMHSNEPLVSRFKIACNFCFEDEIVMLGRDLCAEDKLHFSNVIDCPIGLYASSTCFSLPKFWLHVYNGSFDEEINFKDFSDEVWTLGFVQTLYSCNPTSTAIKYFMRKVSPKANLAIQTAIVRYMEHFADSEPILSPDTYAVLYSILKEDQREAFKGIFSETMFRALLEWPYQKLFLVAAKALTNNLTDNDYWGITWEIMRKAVRGDNDHNYQRLFLDFWRMSFDHRRTLDDRCVNYVLLVREVLLMGNKLLTKLVFDEMSAENRKKFPSYVDPPAAI